MVESTGNQINRDNITYKFPHVHCTYNITYNDIEVQARVLVQAYMYMQVYTQKAAARHDYYRKKK